MNGSDHFMTISRITWDFRRLTDPGKSWGSSFLNMLSMQKVIRFIVEKYPGDDMDLSVPYPTGFHPKTTESLIQWQGFVRDYNRRKLFSFIATGDKNWGKNDLRRLLSDYCRRESGSCLSVDCSVSDCVKNSSSTLIPLLESEFCLQPKGESYTSKAVFECLVAGSVPVFFVKTSYEQYEWFLPGEPESYSVFIEEEEVRNGTVAVKEVLQRYSKEEIRKKRERVIETIPRIIYLKPNAGIKSFKDAFDIAFDGAMERIKEEKEWADFLR
ncbi:hypothetical protein SASPL_118260 [Salvia splendens]|uniref:Exostosin GT47 domain-containing protein n=1 Tax=Salvia splendens TaxID=180675 RepID=A0A8X8XX10_SALSN|nr:hypothetical protein SASPL_118260 [Salvia splendens]